MITKKNSNIYPKKRIFKTKKNRKKLNQTGGTLNIFEFLEKINDSEINVRFKFFTAPDISKNTRSQLIRLYNKFNKDSKKVISKSGSVVKSNTVEVEESPENIDTEFNKKIQTLLDNEAIVENEIQKKKKFL
jgi:hypothetical protein